MSESTEGCFNSGNTIKSKVKNTVKKWRRAIKAALVYLKNGLRQPAEPHCMLPLERAYSDMITTRELAAWAARNHDTACTACTTLTGTTCKLSPRGPLLPALKKAYTGMDTKRDLATFATRNQHTACSTALTGGTPCSSEEESRRQKESHEWASFLYRRRGVSDDIMLA